MPKVTSHNVIAQPTHAYELSQKPTQEEVKIAFVLFLASSFSSGSCFDKWVTKSYQTLYSSAIYTSFTGPAICFENLGKAISDFV